MQSKYDKREEKDTREAPAYRIIPLNVAHFAGETSQNAQKNFPLINYVPLKAIPLNEVRL
jgi:hypothetical protein